MTPDEKLYEQIEEYLDGTMSSRDRSLFEHQLRLDARLAQEVELVDTARFVLKAAQFETLKNQLKTYSKEIEPTHGVMKSMWPAAWKWAVAASIVLTFCFGGWLLKLQSTDAERLFSENFVAYPNIVAPVKMGEPNGSETGSKQKAFVVYEEGRYLNAIPLFEKLIKKEQDPWLLFYLGNAYLGAGRGKEASVAFQTLQDQDLKEFDLLIQTQWYLAMSYLQTKEKKKARQVLEKITLSDNDYTTKASKLLKELR